jgi:hypothetical protein
MTTVENAQTMCLRAQDLIEKCINKDDIELLERAMSHVYNAISINYFTMIVDSVDNLKLLMKQVEESL